ncbi:Cd(II)/Pb(II)-responsive transcriptional regulator [Massilia varians]|uniref:Cd(II)/Pb(II)-responsive transcriptional regulator n=2 Tax=Massilia TaxID=149698 RepID=A0ABT2ARZ2_9BURK|nr:Cd(II)/Pb(II)-responsive transcriptional regulator [Massilia agri]MCS0599021.1 Cd(II)/Pb(II)-responsive transcriptional regulator [Massilia agri]QOY92549.1 Cd(II)/Pb(II)-responsive transcriptional regulator [Massilia sp. UMI-21]
MKIGELADRSGCLVETIRYYERIGLLAPPERSANNYRAYNELHAERLLFIRHCRALDMTLDEIRTLLDFREAPGKNCESVNALLDKHIGHIVDRIANLSVLEAQLRDLRSRCVATNSTNPCEILQALGTADACDEPARLGRH